MFPSLPGKWIVAALAGAGSVVVDVGSQATTGADGCADLPFLACKTLRVEFQAHHGEVRGSEIALVAGDEITEIELK